MGWKATVLTLFPEMFPGPLGISLLGKGLQKKLWQLEVRDIRDHGIGKHGKVDDTPSGGGPGMVMRADVAIAAIDAVKKGRRPLVYPSPRGAPLTQERVAKLAKGPGVVLLCGRFEGLDQRAIDLRSIEEISLGDFVLAGGEIAAMALIEAAVRLIPGVLGAADSPTDESFSNGLLEYPQYTRPQTVEDRPVPEVLNGGNHKKIAEWRRQEAEAATRARRPDLWTLYEKRKG
ncbi:MAG: tRNA (guanosine(37)-N1)-methyltransferase TrmD [Alphaproteobacteria bacterium]|nr:tRNA (guanosine(37)-N1)-methyltransferase TrmD [Alphaproteobacteria bacterium]MBL7097442.1 tRNA (guanosine(37)-N1)-methyltransferase TrmD [Alphaproteobacteria bacterium]